jgi:hypothetical protein
MKFEREFENSKKQGAIDFKDSLNIKKFDFGYDINNPIFKFFSNYSCT